MFILVFITYYIAKFNIFRRIITVMSEYVWGWRNMNWYSNYLVTYFTYEHVDKFFVVCHIATRKFYAVC